MKRLCPNCGYFGAMEVHVVGRRVEIVCPKCGFRVLVIWKPYPSKWRPSLLEEDRDGLIGQDLLRG